MNSPFRFTSTVTAFLAALVVAACVLALWAPRISLILGLGGGLSVAAIWFKVAIRIRTLAWWEFGIESLTRAEGLIGASGAVLFAAAFLAPHAA